MTDLIDTVPYALLQRHELDRYMPLLERELKPEGYDPALVALASLNNCVWVVRAAKAAEGMAHSWRNYKVGAAVLAYNFEKPAMGIMVGGNYKPHQGEGPNYHAEQVALAKARSHGLDTIMAIAVWGDPSDIDANPAQSPTLRPCRRCDDMFAGAPEVTHKTLIVSANQDLSTCELYTAEELREYYTNPNALGPISEVPVYSLAHDMNDQDYTDHILVPWLIPKINELYGVPFVTNHEKPV